MAGELVISNETFDVLLTSTLRRYNSTLRDNIFTNTPYFNIVKVRNRMKMFPGGHQIAPGVLFDDNPTIMSYSGADTLDTQEAQGMTRAVYDWRMYNGATVITEEERLKNSGSKEQLFNLVDEKVRQTEMSFIDRLSRDTFAVQSGKNLDGLRSLIGDSAGTVGGLDETTRDWWVPQRVTTGVTSLNLIETLRTLYNDARKGVKRSQNSQYIWVFTQGVFEEYEDQIEDRARYTLTDEAKKLGFGLDDTLSYKSRLVMWDEDADGGADDERVWLVNTEFLYLFIHTQRNFVTGPMRSPIDADMSVAHTRFMGNFAVDHRRALGVALGISL